MFPLLRAWSDLYNGEHGRAAALMRAFAVRDIAGRHDLELLAAAATVCAEVGTAAQQEWLMPAPVGGPDAWENSGRRSCLEDRQKPSQTHEHHRS
jgi:hypothetical protein